MANIKEKIKRDMLDYLEIMDSSFTKEEGFALFKDIIKQVAALERRLVEKADGMNRDVKQRADKAIVSLEDDVKSLEASFSEKSDTLFEEIRSALNVVYDKLKDIYNYVDDKGETVKQETLSLFPEIPEMKTDTPQEMVNKLESLKGTERLNMKAIDGLEEELTEIRDMTKRKLGGGGVSDNAVRFAFSRMVSAETPTGNINGTNKVYTVTKDIHSVLSFAINGEVIHSSEYTVLNKTITFTTALPAELSGTSFEIVYV